MMTPTSGRPEYRAVSPLKLALARDVQAPGLARAAVSELCERIGLDGSVCQTLVLLVSEVVSNAVLHSAGPSDSPISVSVSAREQRVRVQVTDAGEGFIPAQRDPDRVDGGYGLYLLEKAADRWGVNATPPTSVWFELSMSA